MAYCTVAHVEVRNAARGVFSATSKPNASQVVGYVNDAAALMDEAMFDGGYSVPIVACSVPSTTQQWLQYTNSVGAAVMVEESAQVSTKQDEFVKAWNAALKMLKAGGLPGVTPTGAGPGAIPRSSFSIATPYFSRDMNL